MIGQFKKTAELIEADFKEYWVKSSLVDNLKKDSYKIFEKLNEDIKSMVSNQLQSNQHSRWISTKLTRIYTETMQIEHI